MELTKKRVPGDFTGKAGSMLGFHMICFLLLIGNCQFAFSQDVVKPLFRFGIIADVQYADRENLNTRHYRSSLAKLKESVEVFNREEVSFVLSLGDFIDGDFKSFDTLHAISADLNMPLHHVIGNHDFSVDDEKKNEVLKTLDLKKDYYSFRKKKWRFIILNGNDISLIGNKEGSEKYKEAELTYKKLKEAGEPNAQTWNGTLGAGQLEWMENELKRATRKNEQVILFCHFPLYPEKSAYNLWNPAQIRSIIESYPNVKAYFNGHTHKSQYQKEGDVDYVTFRGMVEKEENAFAIVSVYRDRLEIKGYGAEEDRVILVRNSEF